MFVLPLSLSFKGKLVVIGGALAVSLAGLVAANMYSLWQALLLLSLLLFLALFLIGKKIVPFTLPNQDDSGTDFYNRFDETSVFRESESEQASLSEMAETKIEPEDKKVYETSEHHVAASSEQYDQEIAFASHEQKSEDEKNESADDELIVFDAEFLETRADSLDETENTDEEVAVKSDISDIEKLLEDDFMKTINEEIDSNVEILVKSDLSDIEKMLEDDYDEPVIVEEDESITPLDMDDLVVLPEEHVFLEEDESIQVDDSEEWEIIMEAEPKEDLSREADIEARTEFVMEENLQSFESIEVITPTTEQRISEDEQSSDSLPELSEEWDVLEEPGNFEDLTDETDRVEEIIEDKDSIEQSFDAIEENLTENSLAISEPEILIEELTNLPLESLEMDDSIEQLEDPLVDSTMEKQFGVEEEETFIESDSVSLLEEPDVIEETPIVDATEHVSEFQQQMFQTMVSHLQIAQPQMKDDEFEQLVMSYLHPNIPEQQYYIFASFLIQSYISAKKTEKLHELLALLKKKFIAHPILLQELEFIESRFC